MTFIPNSLRGKRREEQEGKGGEAEPLLFFKNYFPWGDKSHLCGENICGRFYDRKFNSTYRINSYFTLTQNFVSRSYTILFEVIHFLSNYLLN